MVLLPPTAYAAWRTAALAVSCLRDRREGFPGEHLLHLVWQHQRLRREGLRLLDGRSLQVLHPGFWNRGAGPDFRDAVVRIADAPACCGDIEIDLRTSDWRAHHHQINPGYGRVVLHVVWEANREPAQLHNLPTLLLACRLDAPLEELIAWMDLDPGLPDCLIGRCASRWRPLGEEAVEDLLQQAALFRFQRKAVELAARAREAGWEQALWEGLGGALGYHQNFWPMRHLAEQRHHLVAATESPVTLLRLQARLLGVSGLLPHERGRKAPAADAHLRQLWDLWWRERETFQGHLLPPRLWRLGAVRPANHPQRRVALLSHWWVRERFLGALEDWFGSACPPGRLAGSLLECLQVEQDDFWSWHWTLTSEPMDRPQPLLGEARLTDLAINVILPWFWIRAAAGGHDALQREAEGRFLAWPAGQDNAVLRLARMRLFAGDARRCRWTAARQQGLLQFVRDFCGHSNALCDACVLPERLGTDGWEVNQVVARR